MSKINKVLYNVDQRADTTPTERQTARQNIGCPSIKTVDNARPPVYTEVSELTVQEYNRCLSFDNGVKGLLVPEPQYADDGKILMASWSGSASGVTTDVYWGEIPPAGTKVIVYAGAGSLSEADFSTLTSAVSNNELVTILYGASGGASYWYLTKYDSSGFYFTYRNGETHRRMHVATNRNVTIETYPDSTPKAYWLGNVNWEDIITLSGQSSGTHLRDITRAVDEPITFYANHRYLVQSNVRGTAEFVTARDYDGSARWSLCMGLVKSDYDITYPNVLPLASAQFFFNRYKGSTDADYHFIVPIAGITTVFAPTSTITLDHLAIYNSGNVLGSDSSHTTKIYMDYDLGTTVVQEIV